MKVGGLPSWSSLIRKVGPRSLSNPFVGKPAGSGCIGGGAAVWPSSATLVISKTTACFICLVEVFQRIVNLPGVVSMKILYLQNTYDNVPSNLGRCIVEHWGRVSSLF